MTARLIFICHASTDAIRTASFPADEPLDDKGLARAAAVADALPKADSALTSPELRTRQTAQALRLSATIAPTLRDCDYGRWVGRTFEDVQASEPDAVSSWLRDPAATPHGGESIATVIRRVGEWLGARQGHHHRSIVVTHAAIIRAAIICAIDAPPQSFWRIDVAPLSITRLSGALGRWNLSAAGCTAASSSE